MGVETPRQRIWVLGIILGFLAIIALAFAGAFVSLSDENQEMLGHWFDKHAATIWGFVPGAVASVATYLFGRRAGRKVGKTEAYNSAIATATEKPSGNATAAALRTEAQSHGLQVAT
jgi:uncharacterized membrane protein